jgi:hypothetical protein
MHPKVIVKLKKTLKTLSSGQKNPKKKPKKPKKTQKNPKKTTGLGFFKKTRVFSNPGYTGFEIDHSFTNSLTCSSHLLAG